MTQDLYATEGSKEQRGCLNPKVCYFSIIINNFDYGTPLHNPLIFIYLAQPQVHPARERLPRRPVEGRLRGEQAEEVAHRQEGLPPQPQLLPQLPSISGRAGLLENSSIHHESRLKSHQLLCLTGRLLTLHLTMH